MAITTPTTLGLVAREQFMAGLAASAEPVKTIGRNTNFLWRYHSPPAVHFSAWQGTSQLGVPKICRVPIMPSADALRYTLEVATYREDAGDHTLKVAQSTTNSDAASFGASDNFTFAHAGDDVVWRTITVEVPAATRYMEFELDAGASYGQLLHVCMYPTPAADPDATAYDSGFRAIPDTHLEGTGAALHREYFDRVKQNVAYVLRDRRQVVFSAVSNYAKNYQPSGAATYARLAWGPCCVPGQASPVVTVRCRAYADVGGDEYVFIGADGGESVAILADDTDRTAQLRLPGPQCTISITGGFTVRRAMYLRYCTADWAPGDDLLTCDSTLVTCDSTAYTCDATRTV